MSNAIAALERQVIALSLDDPLSSLKTRNRIYRWAFGGNTRSLPLANPGLEALRRYAILSRLFGEIRARSERDRLINAGYNAVQMEAIDTLLATHRPRTTLCARIRNSLLLPAGYRAPGECPPRGPTSGPNSISTRQSVKDFMHQTRNPRSRNALVLAILSLAMAAEAHAQAGSAQDSAIQGSPYGPDAPGGSEGPGGPGGGDQFIVGIGGMYAPRYHGSDKYQFNPLPMIDIKWRRLFANFQDGIGANLYDSEVLTVGAGLTMADGYKAKHAPAGIGKLSMGLGGRGFVKIRQAGFEATLGATKVITGSTEGVLADASLAYPIMASDKLMLIPSIGTTWANRKHNNRYFGVTAAQSAASGLSEYRAGSGLLDAKAELAIVYRVTDRIGVMALGSVSSLMGDAKDSPIVQHKTRPSGIFALTYSF